MKKIYILILLIIVLIVPLTEASNKDTVIKNKLFAITIPKELDGSYIKKVQKDRIEIFHKESKKAGFGGFAFGIKGYKNPSEHSTLPGSKKLGELTDKKGILYDIVLKYPTDVQYDYTKSSKAPESFKLLYDLGEVIRIKGVNGATYYENQGTKGDDLYKDVLKKHIRAISEKWDSIKLEKENLSYMYNVIAHGKNSDEMLYKIGYMYYDVNADGIDELFIGEIAQGNWKGVIYDIYTMVDRKPQHVISGGSRNRFYVCDDAFICNEYSAGAGESGVSVYALLENSIELFPQVGFKYDSYLNKDKPWFISYANDLNNEKWDNIDEQTFIERKRTFEKYKRFEYVPLSTVEQQ